MARFFHVVGVQGAGKSELICALAAHFQRSGLLCAGQDPDIFTTREQARLACPSADIYFIEYLRTSDVVAMPGEQIITMGCVE